MENTTTRTLFDIRSYDDHVCYMCSGTKEVDISADIDDEDLAPCPECQSSYYAEFDDSDAVREQ